jgi:hypothetical protein
MKDWNNVISLYQKNNIYLAEAASILQRSVQFEITALKKQINKCQQQQTVCLVFFYFRKLLLHFFFIFLFVKYFLIKLKGM